MLGARDIMICSNRQTGKKRALTVQSVQSDVASRAADVAFLNWHSLDTSIGDMWFLMDKWRGAMWPNRGLPRGTMV
jgi:hypothetical protein